LKPGFDHWRNGQPKARQLIHPRKPTSF
jgi:hypothetical protein